jgi:GGDEF domain-containing protein
MMSYRAWTYIWLVLLAATGLVAVATIGPSNTVIDVTPFHWVTFGTLVFLATVAQLFEATYGKQSYYPHIVFFFAGVLLLPPPLFIMVIVIPHIVEWGKERWVKGPHLRNWYIQPFNISSHVIAAYVAHWTYNLVLANTLPLAMLSPVVTALAAALIYIAINHILVGQALVLARNISWKQSRVLELPSLLPDVIMGFLGYVVSVLWTINPWLILPAISPLVLMYQALMIPQLKQEAQTDSKTGLWNARHFASIFAMEMDRAKRFNRPVSLIMADLDLLRNINNTYGHMAGDAVLAGIGRIIRETVREYDIAGRFGGEEFAIALPETEPFRRRTQTKHFR